MDNGFNTDSLILMGLYFIVYLFMMIIFTYVFHYPVDLILSVFEGATVSGATSQLQTFVPYYRTALIMVFALGASAPVVWIMMKVFGREPSISVQRRRPFE